MNTMMQLWPINDWFAWSSCKKSPRWQKSPGLKCCQCVEFFSAHSLWEWMNLGWFGCERRLQTSSQPPCGSWTESTSQPPVSTAFCSSPVVHRCYVNIATIIKKKNVKLQDKFSFLIIQSFPNNHKDTYLVQSWSLFNILTLQKRGPERLIIKSRNLTKEYFSYALRLLNAFSFSWDKRSKPNTALNSLKTTTP